MTLYLPIENRAYEKKIIEFAENADDPELIIKSIKIKYHFVEERLKGEVEYRERYIFEYGDTIVNLNMDIKTILKDDVRLKILIIGPELGLPFTEMLYRAIEADTNSIFFYSEEDMFREGLSFLSMRILDHFDYTKLLKYSEYFDRENVIALAKENRYASKTSIGYLVDFS